MGQAPSTLVDRVNALTAECVGSTRVDGGSVALVSDQGARLMMAATDALAEKLESLQIELGEGPFVDAARADEPVLVADLGDADPEGRPRWPFFVRAARSLDVAALFAFPIRVSTVSLGTVGLYRRSPGAMTQPQLRRAARAVEDITHELLGPQGEPADGTGRPTADGLAAEFRDEQDGAHLRVAGTVQLNQAAGMVMVQLEVSIVEAMALLRATAFAENIALSELARDIVLRHRRLGEGAPA